MRTLSFIAIYIKYLCHHVDLHSFPTRRSSDLGTQKGRRPSSFRIRCGKRAAPNARGPRAFGAARFPHRIRKELRSEEHTSELQSRFDIVCRLLLEKKKKKLL